MELKLLITDDEVLDREGLARQLDWKQYSISEVFIAKDGPQALEILRKNDIDILLTDIKMPLMSGIELAQYARQIHPLIQIVFISGYDDFVYAKMAISINVFEYILKPVSTQELATCITNLVERSRKQKEELEQQGSLLRVASEGMQLLRHKLMLDLLFGVYNNIESRMKDMNMLQGASQLTVLLVELNEYHTFPYESRMDRLQEIIDNIDFQYELEPIKVKEDRLGIVVSAHKDTTPCMMEDALVELSKKIVAQASRYFNITIGVGSTVSNYRELCNSYDRSVQALLNKQDNGNEGVLHFTGDTTQDNGRSLHKIEEEIAECLKNLDLVKAMHLLDYLFDSFEQNKDSSINSIQYYCVNIISQTVAVLQNFNVNTDDLVGSTGSLIQKLLKLEAILDIRQWMRSIIRTMIDHLDVKRKSKSREIVEKVIAYVESNYKENISLNKIAKDIYYTPNYLGNIFKQETNRNFNDYLMEYRIRQAATLLCEHDLKVLDVSKLVGYKDMPSFIKNFKSIYGVTPSEYRKFK